MDKRVIPTNGPMNKKVSDIVQGLTFKKWLDSYVSRKEGGRELDCIDTSTQGLKHFFKNSQEIDVGRKTTAWIFQATN